MSKVITYCRAFPAYHPRKGEPTYFVEKIWAGLADKINDFRIPQYFTDWDWYEYYNGVPKWHTVRAGNRWKVGDKFSPRVWSGKPYKSIQLTIAADIEIKKIWTIEIYGLTILVNNTPVNNFTLLDIAHNDGLGLDDFKNWFNKVPFIGQIISWNAQIEYV